MPRTWSSDNTRGSPGRTMRMPCTCMPKSRKEPRKTCPKVVEHLLATPRRSWQAPKVPKICQEAAERLLRKPSFDRSSTKACRFGPCVRRVWPIFDQARPVWSSAATFGPQSVQSARVGPNLPLWVEVFQGWPNLANKWPTLDGTRRIWALARLPEKKNEQCLDNRWATSEPAGIAGGKFAGGVRAALCSLS